MKIIEGFTQARTILSRELPSGLYPISDGLKRSLKKMFGTDDPEQAVRIIIAEVRRKGDAALFDYAATIDGMKLASLEISRKQIANAYKEMDLELLSALKLAAKRIESFHSAQKKSIWHEVTKDGLEQRIRPLERIGAYVPGVNPEHDLAVQTRARLVQFLQQDSSAPITLEQARRQLTELAGWIEQMDKAIRAQAGKPAREAAAAATR